MAVGVSPEKAEDDVGDDGDDVEKGEEIHGSDEVKNVIENNNDERDDAENGDDGCGMGGFEAREMDYLCDNEDDDASFGDVVDGENDVGGDGGEHGELQEMVAWKNEESV